MKLTIFTLLLVTLSYARAQDAVDTIVEQFLKTQQVPGAVIGVVKDDKLVKWEAYGFADVQNGAAVNPLTSFELGSLTKQFTAAAILKLQQQGKLSVEDNLSTHFPECPEHWKAIKIKHLIWHTSGLPGMYPHDDFRQSAFTGYATMSSKTLDLMMQTNSVTKERSIQSIISDSLDFQPGERYNYSDVGYLVLGIVIDNVAGGYRDYMIKHIFEAAGLKNTYLLDQSRVVINQSRGYSLKKGELINIMRTWDYEIPSFFGIFSNVEDLVRWNEVLESDEVLNEQSRAFLFNPGVLNNGTKTMYGGGWQVNIINGVKLISHDGVTGVRMIRVPEERFCLILLTNLGYNGNDFVDPFSVTSEVLPMYDIETKIKRNHTMRDGQSVVPFRRKHLKNLAGEYITVDGLKATVTVEEGVPYFESYGGKYELVKLEQGEWLVLDMEFEYSLRFNAAEGTLTSNLGRVFRKE